MARELKRGAVVEIDDPFCAASGRRPYVIISDESYPFYPHGYMGVPFTSKDKSNTVEIKPSDVVAYGDVESFDRDFPLYVNPYSPYQVNDTSMVIAFLDQSLVDIFADRATKSFGLTHKA